MAPYHPTEGRGDGDFRDWFFFDWSYQKRERDAPRRGGERRESSEMPEYADAVAVARIATKFTKSPVEYACASG